MIRSLTLGPSMIFHSVASHRIAESSANRSGVVLRTEASPRARNIIDSVAMKGCTLKYWISTPEIAPNTVREKILRKITTDGDSPALASIYPETQEKDI